MSAFYIKVDEILLLNKRMPQCMQLETIPNVLCFYSEIQSYVVNIIVKTSRSPLDSFWTRRCSTPLQLICLPWASFFSTTLHIGFAMSAKKTHAHVYFRRREVLIHVDIVNHGEVICIMLLASCESGTWPIQLICDVG
jgi:hypothetical protein